MKIQILISAVKDLEEGRIFYEKQGVGLGDYFFDTKNQSERALVLAHYLEKVKNMESFNTADLTEIGRVAKQPKFTNISDTVAKLVQQDQLMGAGERESKRVFVLTTTGEECVENLLKPKQE